MYIICHLTLFMFLRYLTLHNPKLDTDELNYFLKL